MSSQARRSLELVDDRHCFACGEENSQGLKMRFRLIDDGIESEFTPSKHHQGFNGILHGGIMALILDEVMVNLTWIKKLQAVTAELKDRLKKPAPIGKKIRLTARIKLHKAGVVRTEAFAYDENNELLAEAEAACVRMKSRG